MSRSVASLILVRGGKREIFEEVWGMPYRDLLWGPTEFEGWASARDTAEYEPEELSALVVADYDSKVLQWFESESPKIPAINALYKRLLSTAWQGFEIRELTEQQAYRETRSIWQAIENESESEADEGELSESSDNGLIEQDDPLEWRAETIEVASLSDSDDEEMEMEGVDEEDHGEVAWVSIIDGAGEPRHRVLFELSKDLLTANSGAVPMLAKQRPAAIPAEQSTVEGICIDIPGKRLGVWGNSRTLELFPRIQSAWQDWEVSWLDGCYREHCKLVGTPGKVMSEEKGLASFIPFMLETKKMDMSQIVGEMGGAIKRTAMKAVGCFTLVLAFPMLLTGLFLGKLMQSLYAIATLVVVIAVVFKIAEWRLKAKFQSSPFARMTQAEPDSRPPVAGPLNEGERRQAMDRLLAAAGLPSWQQIEPHVEKYD